MGRIVTLCSVLILGAFVLGLVPAAAQEKATPQEIARLIEQLDADSFDDREVKPANIALHIGRRPILAFGNSDGDLAMLRYTKAGPGLRLALLLHHDDSEREFAYDREFRLSPLVEALDKADEYGIVVVSMKQAWRSVFPDSGGLR